MANQPPKLCLRIRLRIRLVAAASAVLNDHGRAHGCEPMNWTVPDHTPVESPEVRACPGGDYTDADGLVVCRRQPNTDHRAANEF
jgi:hypothetical protein